MPTATLTPEHTRCWKACRQVWPECGIVAELRARVQELRAEVARLQVLNVSLAERREPSALDVIAAAERAAK